MFSENGWWDRLSAKDSDNVWDEAFAELFREMSDRAPHGTASLPQGCANF